MIFYFTATGNSLYVAKQLEGKIFSIPQEMKKSKREYSAKQIGIVCPTFGHEVPSIVKAFIKNSEFNTNYFFIISTYGFHHGGCAELTQEYLEGIGKKADYINSMIMVDNALPGFDIEEQLLMDEEKDVEKHIALIKADIAKEKTYIQQASNIDKEQHRIYLERTGKIEPSGENPLYKVDENCVNCKTCIKVCPKGCISSEDGRISYDYTVCEGCLACIHACPKKAIKFVELKEKNPNKHYLNPNIKIGEIIMANYQARKEV